MRKQALGHVAAIGLAVVAAYGIGGTSAASAAPTTVAEIANYTGNDRQQMLEDGAKREGALMIYTTGTQIQPLLDRFRQKYPYLRIQLPRASSVEVAVKVTQEYAAGVFLVDAFELNADGLILPREQGVLAPFTSPEAANFEPNAIEGGRHWISVRESYTGIGFNTTKISPAEAPHSYEDLLDPK